MAAIGGITNKHSHRSLVRGKAAAQLGRTDVPAAYLDSTGLAAALASEGRAVGVAEFPLAVWKDHDHERAGNFLWGLKALGMELSKGSFHVGWVLTLIGLWCFRGHFRVVPGACVVLVVCLVTLVTL